MSGKPITPPFPLPTDPCCEPQQHSILYRYRHILILISLTLLLGLIYWRYGDVLLPMVKDQVALKQFVMGVGWWGPLALIALNILQIIIAPIPGYLIYIVAGYLYGPWLGGIWGSIGMLLGGGLAMLVGRKLGRPIVQRLIGEQTLNRWEDATRSNSTFVWGALLLSPIGDAPFLLAGLSKVSYTKIIVLTIITRVPVAFIAAAIGSGALHLTQMQCALLVAALAIPILLLSRYQQRIMASLERFVNRRSSR